MRNSTPTLKTERNGTRRWTLNGKLHRADGPAVEYIDGTKSWWFNGELHRVDGPAIEYYDGTKEWRLYGKLHRIDGPAVEWADGAKVWYIKGQEIYVPYTYLLNAAFNRGLPIPDEAMLAIAKATSETKTSGEQIGSLKTILNKYWPMHVHKILATLFSNSDPTIKHVAFSLLGGEALPDSMLNNVVSSQRPDTIALPRHNQI